MHEIIVKKCNNIKQNLLDSGKRYVDDSFMFWKCLWGNTDDLHDLIQNLNPKIKFINFQNT